MRVPWEEVPERVRAEIEARLGSQVLEAVTQPQGFSPALAARLRTASGERAFVKAVGPDRNPDSPAIYRREARVMSRLPPDLPVPNLLWWLDEGPGGWVVLAFEDVDGRHPGEPWDGPDLAAVLAALDRLAAALTPAPIDARPAGDLVGRWQGWRLLAEEGPAALDAWSRRNLSRLVELEAAAPAALAGHTLVHLDVRADNLLLAERGVYVLDWPWASRGPAWTDPLVFACSVEMQGGPEAAQVFAGSAAGRTADPEAVNAVLAALTGMFVQRGRLPPPPGLPTLRQFQSAQGAVGRRWLGRRTGWR